MYSDAEPYGAGVSESTEIIRSLTLAGHKGRVRAVLSKKQISFESRSGHALDLHLDAVQRVHHSHTNLIPGWMALVGLLLVWISFRTLNGSAQAIAGSVGIVLSTGHLITRRPTLTIDTTAGDCHSVFGNDATLMRMCTMIQRLRDGATMEESRRGLEILSRDAEYPRTQQLEAELIPEPLEIMPNPVISAFLDEIEIEDAQQNPQIEPISSGFELPDWFEEVETVEQEVPAGLLSRSKDNLHTRRNQVASNGWMEPAPAPAQHYQGVYRQEMADENSFEMIRGVGMVPVERQQPQQSQMPTHFLPSFVGTDGAHIPHSNPESFNSPDQALPVVEEQIEEVSLVADARRSDIIQAELSEDGQEQADRYPHFSRLSQRSPSQPTRLSTTSNKRKSLTASSVVKELVGPSLIRAGNIGRKLKNRFRTGDALRLQARNAHSEEVVQSIRELAESNGGIVPDGQVSSMMAHIGESIQPIPQSFEDLVVSDDVSDAISSKLLRIDL